MNTIYKKATSSTLILNVFFILLFNYAFQDVTNSRNIGLREPDRRLVHAAVISVTAFLTLYFALTIHRNLKRINSTIAVMALYSSWAIFVDIIQQNLSWAQFVRFGLSVLWILLYYFFSTYPRKFEQPISIVGKRISVLFLIYLIASFYAFYTISATYKRVAVVNMVYNVLVFLPWILLLPKGAKKNIGLFLVTLSILVSMKRGAIVAFSLMLATAFMVEAIVKQKKPIYLVKGTLALITFIIGLTVANHYTYGFLFERFSSEELSKGSGRVELYTVSMEVVAKRDIVDLFVGTGSATFIDKIGTSVHNEWIGVLYAYGIVGVFLYFFIVYSLIGKAFKLISQRSQYAVSHCVSVVYFIVVGMYGQIYDTHSTMIVMAVWGIVNLAASYEVRHWKRGYSKTLGDF